MWLQLTKSVHVCVFVDNSVLLIAPWEALWTKLDTSTIFEVVRKLTGLRGLQSAFWLNHGKWAQNIEGSVTLGIDRSARVALFAKLLAQIFTCYTGQPAFFSRDVEMLCWDKGKIMSLSELSALSVKWAAGTSILHLCECWKLMHFVFVFWFITAFIRSKHAWTHGCSYASSFQQSTWKVAVDCNLSNLWCTVLNVCMFMHTQAHMALLFQLTSLTRC